ncbi:Hypothetical predicted protein [Paramuricea clavata]|uniref:Uncharacterized protein n=1 Tax=Paramuricea clavata TaxID=317549 RepID=A0A7D9I2X6_PARCT|nr:Hypothetical predicted protein [Paramuricea clavata]
MATKCYPPKVLRLMGMAQKCPDWQILWFCHFSILCEEEKVMSAKGIHPLAIINSKEDYNVLQTAGREMFKEINELINAGKIDVKGKEIKFQFFLGGDYKAC